MSVLESLLAKPADVLDKGAVVAISNGIGPIIGASLSSINSESW